MLGKLFERYARLAGVPKHRRHFHVLKRSIAMHAISESRSQVDQQHRCLFEG
jgi:hypothetical protein